METLTLLGKTVLLRPYVFIFLFFYLLSAIALFGHRRTLLFTMITWSLAFASEWCSTRYHFPYGLYHYIETTRGQELWISNVPFMDSLSYTFLNFSALAIALHMFGIKRFVTPLWQSPVNFLSCLKISVSSGLLVMLLDVLIDPVAHQGEKWFLGKIYYYPDPGYYFGIPAANFAGWFLVGSTSVLLFFLVERRLQPNRRVALALPLRPFWGVGLYLGVAFFNIAVAFYIKDFTLGWVSSAVLLATLLGVGWFRQRLQG